MTTNGSGVNRADIQGLVAFGYGKLTEASYLLLRIRDAEAARAWCANAPLSTAEFQSPGPDTALQIGFTPSGLRKLAVPENVIASFSPEFVSGMSGEANRSRRLGDTGENDPAEWEWGAGASEPDAIVLAFAKEHLDSWLSMVRRDPWNDAFEEIGVLGTSDMRGREPFGFLDGISQPEIDWKQELKIGDSEIDYRNRCALGEFVLGYKNEYGRYTDRPVIDAALDRANVLPKAEDDSSKKDVARNGAYLVVRQLEQDVRGFWRFIKAVAGDDVAQMERLSALLVGRTRAGEPLIPSVGNNEFTYEADAPGLKCPLGAHIRRANPRSTDLVGKPGNALARVLNQLAIPRPSLPEDLIASTRFHRILRRGREYGRWIAPEDALRADAPADTRTGIHFACINASIARQFEFVQGAWLASAKFDGLSEESDPLLGTHGSFSIPQEGRPAKKVTGLPQFVRVRGGAYFFLPGLAALRFFVGR